MCNIDYLIQKDNRLKPVFGCILTFINKKLRNSEYNYVDTTLYELQKITKHKTKGATSKVVSKLCDWGYLQKELFKEEFESGWKHLRLRFGNSLETVEKPCITEQTKDFCSRKRFPKDETNIYIINKSNKSNKSINPKIFEEKIDEKTETINANSRSTIVQDMIEIWNQEFPNQKIISDWTKQTGTIYITKRLARFLVASFKLKFENCLGNWKRYLRLIKTSTYLMGEKFKLSVQWAIKFLTIDRIRAGELGVDEKKILDALGQTFEGKGEMEITETTELKQSAYNHINTLKESERCKNIRRKIVRCRGANVYFSWFTKVKLEDVNGEIKLCSDNAFAKDWINTQYGWELC